MPQSLSGHFPGASFTAGYCFVVFFSSALPVCEHGNIAIWNRNCENCAFTICETVLFVDTAATLAGVL